MEPQKQREEVEMEESKNTRIIEIDGHKFKVKSIFDESSNKDIINFVYDKFRDKDHDATLCLINNPYYKENEK